MCTMVTQQQQNLRCKNKVLRGLEGLLETVGFEVTTKLLKAL